MSIAHGGMNPRAEKPKMPAKELEHVRMYKGDGENGGHIIEHHHTAFEHPPERMPFEAHGGEKPVLPAGHVLQHIAKVMGIPHSVIEEKNESADKTDAKGHEPDEEEELEEE